MKFSKISKSLVAGCALAGASLSANAGVVATSYLDVQSFGIVAFYDEAMTQPVSPQDLGAFIKVSGGTRSAQTSTGFNGVGLPDTRVFATGPNGTGEADGVFDCAGPSCNILGVSNNSLIGQHSSVESIHTDSLANGYGYAVADSVVDGSALVNPAVPASGMTYAGASVGGANNDASATSDITDSLTTVVNFAVQGVTELYLSFTASYSLFVEASQTPDVAADPTQTANATASANFNIGLGTDSSSQNGGSVGFDLGAGFVDVTNLFPLFPQSLVSASDDFTGSDTGVSVANGSSATGFYRVGEGDYQVSIVQASSAGVSLVSAPGTLAIAGLGLLGLAAARRRKS
tara:strand:- start:613 stop:1650 length:1038 start_codon:yes stop_codon:yes gene_type:complete